MSFLQVLKGYLDIVPREEVAVDVYFLSTKYLIVDWKTYTLSKNFMYYKIIRGDGISKNYKILSEMLYDFDRQDVVKLYRLVNERYSSSKPEGYDLMLWGDLHTLFEPDEEIMENIDAYRDDEMGDVIVGKSFGREICVKEKRFNGMIGIYNGKRTRQAEWNVAPVSKAQKFLQRCPELRTQIYKGCED
ncbi:hypothetical protein Tco_0602489 [Tanacetum coccineum]